MRVRLEYVFTTMILKNVTAYSLLTYTHYKKLGKKGAI